METKNTTVIIFSFLSLLLSLFILPTHLHAHHYENPFLRNSEFLIDSTISYIPVISSGYGPSVVFNNSHYFAVWADQRCQNSTQNIFGTRIRQTGEIIDSAGIAISLVPFDQNTPSVEYSGTQYLVVWGQASRDGNDYSVYGIRVDTSGTLIDSSEILIATTTSDYPVHPVISFGGKYYFVTWIDKLNTSIGSIHGVRIDTSGTIIDTSAIEIAPLASSPPSVGFDGEKFFVIFSFGSQIQGFRIDTSGSLIDTTEIIVVSGPGGKYSPSLTFFKNKYLVVWENSGTSQDIYCIRVDTSGIVVDSAAIPLFTGNYSEVSPRCTFDGSRFFFVWEDRRASSADIYGGRVDTSCTVLDTSGIPLEIGLYEQRYPSVAGTGTQFFSAWVENSRFVGGTRIDSSGGLLDSINLIISTAANPQFNPSVSQDGERYLVVWQDKRNGEDFDIYGARVDSVGVILDQNCITILAEQVNQQKPKVAFDGSKYLVLWQDDRYMSIYGTRIDTTGNVLEPSGFRISLSNGIHTDPSLTFDGRNYFAVWYQSDGNNLFGTRIDTSGSILDPPGIQISFDPATSENIQTTASNGSNYLVIWYDNGIQGIIVDTTGTVSDTVPFLITQDYYGMNTPSITSNGQEYFIVWEDLRNSEYDIYGARVSGSGTLIDTNGLAIYTEGGEQKYPSCTFNGTDYIVLWEDHAALYTDIKGARVGISGNVLDTFSVITQKWNQITPTLIHGPNDRYLVAYSGFTDSIGGRPANSMRIWGRIFNTFVGVGEKLPHSTKSLISLEENIPNPAVTHSKISYSVSGNGEKYICLTVYNIIGQKIKTLVKENQSPGKYTIRWDLLNDMGELVSNGIYFLQLKGCERTITRKMIVLR
jgi:hypothetical protein